MRSVCGAALLCLLAAVAWHHRQDLAQLGSSLSWRHPTTGTAQTRTSSALAPAQPCTTEPIRCTPASTTPSTVWPRRPATPPATLVRKCVNGSSVLYTDEHCPHGHQPMALTGGTFNVVSGRSTDTEPADETSDNPVMGGLPERVMQLAARF